MSSIRVRLVPAMEEPTKSTRMYVIMATVAVLCFSMWAQSDPVVASDAALPAAVSSQQPERATQTSGSTSPTGTPMQAIPPAEGQACDQTQPEGAAAMAGSPKQFAQNCIPRGQKCTLGGTPCCAPYTCIGVFPNLTCQ
jgi:hypothetical protein